MVGLWRRRRQQQHHHAWWTAVHGIHRARPGVHVGAGDVWHALVKGLPQSGILYGFKVAGQGGWDTPNRWDPKKASWRAAHGSQAWWGLARHQAICRVRSLHA